MKLPQTETTKDPNRAVARLLAEVLEPCGHCGSQPLGHEYALLATLATKKENDGTLLEFFKALKDRQWAKLREFQSWRGTTDNVELYAIRCSRRNVTVAVIKSHFELLQPARLLYREALPTEEGKKLHEAFANLEWRPI